MAFLTTCRRTLSTSRGGWRTSVPERANKGDSPMSRHALTRRRFLVTASAGAGLLVGGGMVSRPPAAVRIEPPLIPRRLLFAGADRSTVRISPDGRRLAFMAPIDGVLNLWVGD